MAYLGECIHIWTYLLLPPRFPPLWLLLERLLPWLFDTEPPLRVLPGRLFDTAPLLDGVLEELLLRIVPLLEDVLEGLLLRTVPLLESLERPLFMLLLRLPVKLPLWLLVGRLPLPVLGRLLSFRP